MEDAQKYFRFILEKFDLLETFFNSHGRPKSITFPKIYISMTHLGLTFVKYWLKCSVFEISSRLVISLNFTAQNAS